MDPRPSVLSRSSSMRQPVTLPQFHSEKHKQRDRDRGKADMVAGEALTGTAGARGRGRLEEGDVPDASFSSVHWSNSGHKYRCAADARGHGGGWILQGRSERCYSCVCEDGEQGRWAANWSPYILRLQRSLALVLCKYSRNIVTSRK